MSLAVVLSIIGNITPTPSRTGEHLKYGEEFEMTQLLPSSKKEDRNDSFDNGLDCEVVIRKKNPKMPKELEEENGNNKMVLSRTSDLTASITSNEFTIRGLDSPNVYCKQTTAIKGASTHVIEKKNSIGYDNNDDDDYDEIDRDSGGGGSNSGFSETDTLLCTRKASQILNLTHIEDNDICFADD